jgi:SWI/SNF-related matrix-associated actin-dependent regulator of chromatin subfamily D
MIPFSILPELANRYLAPPNPVDIYYTVNPTAPPPERPAAWDIELKLEDIALKSKMQSVTLNASRDTLRELTKLDDEVRTGAMRFCIELTITFRRSRRLHSHFNHPS